MDLRTNFMELNTPHFNAIASQFLTEAKKTKKKEVKKPVKATKKKYHKSK
jgi:hypothetical protein